MRNLKLNSIAPIAIVALAIALTAPAAASDMWIHVRVEEDGGAKVSVNLPLSFVESILDSSMVHGLDMDEIVIDDLELSMAELREMWNTLQNSPDMTFVTVKDHDENVQVSKREGYLLVQVSEDDDDTRVDAKIPANVVDALLSGNGNELNISAALGALADHGEGELVTVNDRNDFVRVWIDNIPEAD